MWSEQGAAPSGGVLIARALILGFVNFIWRPPPFFVNSFLRSGIPPRHMVGCRYHPARWCGSSPRVLLRGKAGRRHFGVALVPMVDIFLISQYLSGGDGCFLPPQFYPTFSDSPLWGAGRQEALFP